MTEPVSKSVGTERFLPQESFFKAQTRNRRATWKLSVLCAFSATAVGVPLALVITPLLYGVVLIMADVVNLLWPVPADFWREADQFARFGKIAFDWLLQQKSADPQTLVMGAAVMLVPGMLFSFALWAGLNLLFRRSGTGGALLALSTREPDPTTLKELQLVDVVQEMAIAAGLPAPRVMLIDAPGANACVLGAGPQDARIVVSRVLLDVLEREELEGLLAHLVSSVGNGDLRIAMRMTAVFEACGLLLTIINAPFGPQARRTLWRLGRYWIRAGKSDAGESAAVADLLTRSADLDTDDIDRFMDPAGKKSMFRSFRTFLFFPIFLTNLAVKLLLWVFLSAMVGPPLALLWRTRQYLADASAIQLTRNPDALARALQKLSQEPGQIPGGDWAAHLFLVGPGRGEGREIVSLSAQQRQLMARVWAESAGRQSASGMPVDFPALSKQISATVRAALAGDVQATTRLRSAYHELAAADPQLSAQVPNPDDILAARQGDFSAMARLQAARRSQSQAASQDDSSESQRPGLMDFHPPLKRRLKRLAKLGAQISTEAGEPKARIVIVVLFLILGPFVLAAVALLLLLIAILIMASLTFVVIWLAAIHQLFALAGGPHV
jgi:Zn-dependent protease with chaperone function